MTMRNQARVILRVVLYRKVLASLLIIQIHVMLTSSHTVEYQEVAFSRKSKLKYTTIKNNNYYTSQIDIQDTKVFEIALDDMNYDEESENEMIQPVDLVGLRPLTKDEDRYKPLHSHVQHYNERNAENKKLFPNIFQYLQPHVKEIFNLEQEDKPFIAGFKHELDKITIAHKTSNNYAHPNVNRRKNTRSSIESQNCKNCAMNVGTGVHGARVKREEMENYHWTTPDEDTDFLPAIRDENVTSSKVEATEYLEETQATHMQYDAFEYDQRTSEDTKDGIQFLISNGKATTAMSDTESPDEESYDYEKFKAEYEQQLEYGMKSGKMLNYTEKKEQPEDAPREALKRIMIDMKKPKNCTKEEISRIGIKAIECLAYDYQRTRDIATAGRVLSKTWLVLKVWLLIYICLAIPCWCQRGWCCCCFCCKFCFPRKRISFAKQYYTMNPPGILVKDLKKLKDTDEPFRYEATEYERDAYKEFEITIRHI